MTAPLSPFRAARPAQPLVMLDLCAGLGGASQAMRTRGWTVWTLDYDAQFKTDIVADVRDYHWAGGALDLIWASPPCDEFAREFMPWSATGKTPSLELVDACKRIIAECRPRYYVIENVKGAQWHLGKADQKIDPFYLWTNLPPIGRPRLNMRRKENMSSSWAAERAMIPYALSEAVARTVEQQIQMVLA